MYVSIYLSIYIYIYEGERNISILIPLFAIRLHGTTYTKPIFYTDRRSNAKIQLEFHRFYFGSRNLTKPNQILTKQLIFWRSKIQFHPLPLKITTISPFFPSFTSIQLTPSWERMELIIRRGRSISATQIALTLLDMYFAFTQTVHLV